MSEIKISKPYDDVELQFYEKSHRFKANGEWVDLSVSAITGIVDKSRPLIYWATGLMRDNLIAILEENSDAKIGHDDIIFASKLHAQFLKKAADKGTMVHNWIEKFLKGLDPELPEEREIKNGVLAFLKWMDKNDVKMLNSESHIYSKKHKYAGILDLEAEVNGKLAIVDFKTSNGLYPEMRLQVAGYQIAMEEMTGKEYEERWLIRFDKETGEFHDHLLGDFAKDKKAFIGAIPLKRRIKELDTYKK
jgi:hypothetical protein|tara:strand:- start:4763 stop:5506 length:744 start_codon:yes stop_codon:yes gene_type:complete